MIGLGNGEQVGASRASALSNGNGNADVDVDSPVVKVYIPLCADSTIDMEWLGNVVSMLEKVYGNIAVFAALYEAADSVM